MSASEADLVLVEQFLNTLDERTFSHRGEQHVASDRLTSAEAWSDWAQAQGLAAPGEPAAASDLAAALALRTALREALAGAADDARVTQALAGFPMRLAPDPAGGLHITAASGVPALDVIVESVAAGAAGGDLKRLKLCASPDCRWAFYDTSRSGGGRWCSMDVCGNRHKTRAYRRRLAN